MRPLELTRREYEPPSLCYVDPITLFGLGTAAAGTAGAAGTAAAVAAPVAAASSILPTLGTIGTVAGVVGTGLQMQAQADQAEYEQAVATNQAEALRIKAGEETAAAQRKQIDQETKARLLTSRARAVAGASGTDPSSPGILDIEEDIYRQGKYNALSSLYEGLSAARSDNYQADLQLFKAGRIRRALPLAQGGTLLSGIGTFADRSSFRRNYSGGGYY